MRRFGALLIVGLVPLAPTVSSAHKSRGLTVRQRVLSKDQAPEPQLGQHQAHHHQRRNQPVRGRCIAVIEGRWTNPTTLENRTY